MQKIQQPFALHHKKLFASTILVVVVFSGTGYFAYGHYLKKNPVTSPPKIKSVNTEPNIKVPTYSTQVNGQTVQVPTNVPRSSIQNYTLITQNSDYEIQELDGAYTITLYPIVNHASEATSYRQELHDYKQEALQYLTQHSVNINRVSITYDPSEAAQD
jgi:hypothetical protein